MLDSNKGLYAGSFDPVHHGHIDMACEHAEKLDSLTIGIGYNPAKATTGAFHPVERKKALEHALLDLPEDITKKIHVDFINGLLVDYCQERGIKHIFKSYRNDSDYRDEMMQVYYNQQINPDIETILVKASDADDLPYVSSSGEKMLMKLQGNQTSPDTTLLVKHAMETRLNKQYIIGMVGEIGSGKSYTGEQFVQKAKELGIEAHNIDFDSLGHTIHKAGPAYAHVREDIRKAFGDSVIHKDGSTNTRALGKMVFADKKKLDILNDIMRQSLRTELRKSLTGKTGLIIINSAILAEHNLGALTNNNVVSVSVERATQIARILSRENSDEKRTKAGDAFVPFTEQEALDRIANQYSTTEKNAYYAKQQADKRYGNTIQFDNTAPTNREQEKAFHDMIDTVDNDLSLRFGSLYKRLELTGNATDLFQKIYFQYLSNNLAYHNWDGHIRSGLHMIHQYRHLMEDPDLVEIAWFFHDMIYNPQNMDKKNSNEFFSADTARKRLIQHGMDPLKAQKVYSLIMATKHEGRYAYTNDEKWIIDIDLSILSENEAIYYGYANGIQQEYSFVPQKDYIKGRSSFLLSFLKKDTIYLTPEFQQRNDIAKHNLRAELTAIKNRHMQEYVDNILRSTK